MIQADDFPQMLIQRCVKLLVMRESCVGGRVHVLEKDNQSLPGSNLDSVAIRIWHGSPFILDAVIQVEEPHY